MSCSKFAYKEEPLPAEIEIKSADRKKFCIDRETISYFGAEVVEDLSFTCCVENGKQTVVPLIDFDAAILSVVFRWIGSRKLEAKHGSTMEDQALEGYGPQVLRAVLAAANYLQLPGLAKAVAKVLKKEHGIRAKKCPTCRLPMSGGVKKGKNKAYCNVP